MSLTQSRGPASSEVNAGLLVCPSPLLHPHIVHSRDTQHLLPDQAGFFFLDPAVPRLDMKQNIWFWIKLSQVGACQKVPSFKNGPSQHFLVLLAKMNYGASCRNKLPRHQMDFLVLAILKCVSVLERANHQTETLNGPQQAPTV